MASPKRQKTSFLEAEDAKNEGNHVPVWVQKGRERAQQEAYRCVSGDGVSRQIESWICSEVGLLVAGCCVCVVVG